MTPRQRSSATEKSSLRRRRRGSAEKSTTLASRPTPSTTAWRKRRSNSSDLAAVVFYDNPVLTLDRILKTLIAAGEKGLPSWIQGAPSWLGVKLFVEKMVRSELKVELKVLFVEHHLSHAASAFFPSPFEEAAVLTIDGVGEWATTTLGKADRDEVRILEEIYFPHSLGLLYSTFTQYCGFKVNSGEYKLMGLAPYGKPIYADRIRSELMDLKDDGSFRLNTRYFGYLNSLSMTNADFHDLFEGPPRQPESRITRREMDLAASIQLITEEVLLKIARHLRNLTGLANLCMAGGVALNCVANGKLLREKIFDQIWIQPAAGDAGGALGAAMLGAHCYLRVPRPPVCPRRDRQKGSYLGPSFTNEEIRAFLDFYGYPYAFVDGAERSRQVAKSLAAEKIVGYFVGRAEFGPRSLGARSILGDARSPTTQSTMNLKIKFRESFRPFAPSVLEEQSSQYFDLSTESPYMLLIAPVREHLRKPLGDATGEDLIQIVNQTLQHRPGHHPRRLQRPGPDSRSGGEAGLLPAAAGVRDVDWHGGYSEHLLQRAGRAYRPFPAGRLPVLHEDRYRRLGAGELHPPQGGAAPVPGQG